MKWGAMAFEVVILTERVPECARVLSNTAAEPEALESTTPYPKMVLQPGGTSPAAPFSKSSLMIRSPPPELLLELEELELDELLLELELDEELLLELDDELLELELELLELLVAPEEPAPPQPVSISARAIAKAPQKVLVRELRLIIIRPVKSVLPDSNPENVRIIAADSSNLAEENRRLYQRIVNRINCCCYD